MQSTTLRMLLPLALAAALGACSDQPEADASKSDAGETAAAPSAAAEDKPAKALPTATSAFERALRTLTNGGNVRFESETTLVDGSSQYATGAGSVANASFILRTLPQGSAQFDGNWLLQGGRYLKETGTTFDAGALTPPAVANMYAAIAAIPQSDSAFTSDAPTTQMVGSAGCTARKVDLSRDARLIAAYKALEICVDEPQARLIRLSAELQSGERLTATFSGHGEPVQIPQTQVKDWSQEYPLR
jgi:hypothetical protein